MFIDETYLSIFKLKSDSEKELRSQIVFAKSYTEVIDDFRKQLKYSIIDDEAFLLKSMEIKNIAIDNSQLQNNIVVNESITKRIVEGSYAYSPHIEEVFKKLPVECMTDNIAISCEPESNFNYRVFTRTLVDSVRSIDLQITLYDGIDDDII